MDCSLPGSSVRGIFPGTSTGVGCHFLLQRIFPTQGSNPCLPHCRQTLYRLSHQGSLLHCAQTLYHLSHQGSPYLSSMLKVKVVQLCLLFVIPWIIAHQAPLSLEFSRQEYWSGWPFPSLGDLPNLLIEPVSPLLAGGFSYIGLSHQESPKDMRLNPIPCDFGS